MSILAVDVSVMDVIESVRDITGNGNAYLRDLEQQGRHRKNESDIPSCLSVRTEAPKGQNSCHRHVPSSEPVGVDARRIVE